MTARTVVYDSGMLVALLRGKPAALVLHILEGARHGDPRFEAELTQPALDWMDHLRQPS